MHFEIGYCYKFLCDEFKFEVMCSLDVEMNGRHVIGIKS